MKSMLNVLSVLAVSAFVTANAGAQAIQNLKTFDGQSVNCERSLDDGRIGYRMLSTNGVIREGNVEIKIDLETMKCSADATGVFSFRPEGLGGRHVNANGGFLEFTNLEVVGYTPDLSVVKAQPVDLGVGAHSVTLVAPVKSFTGLYARNAYAAKDRRIVMMVVLRGQASLGNAATGKVLDRSSVPFGTYTTTLSEKEGSLTFAPAGSSMGSPSIRVSSAK